MATKCPHSDVDVNGYCYACGAYVEGRDAGALRPLREASQDEDGEDR
jgi:hypothetical protein